MEEPPPPPPRPAMAAVLTDDFLLTFILKRLSPVYLVRAALACHRWRRAAAVAIPRAPPLLGYFVHTGKTQSPPLMARAELPAVFVPSDASGPRISLDLAHDDSADLAIHDVHLGLVLLLPAERLEMLPPRILVLDPASRRRALLPPPPRDALPDDETRLTIGAAVLSRAHPSRLAFEAVCVTLDDGRLRAWVAAVHDDNCVWRALPQSKLAMDHLDPFSFDKRCFHAEGKIYWSVCNSDRLVSIDTRTLEFSLLIVTAELGRPINRVGLVKKGEDSCYIASAEKEHPKFPYSLCWPPDFLATLKGDTWTETIMYLIRVAVYNISYIRRLFGEGFFGDMPLCPIAMSMLPAGVHIKTLTPIDEESQRLTDWIDRGVYDALQKRFLRSILFGIFEDDGPLIEEYCLSFCYGEDIAMDLRLKGCTESIWTLTSNEAESLPSQVWSFAFTMVQKLVSLLRNLNQIPVERVLMMKLLYYDDVTPLNYEPPFFQCFDDIRKVSCPPRQSILRDVAQDMMSLRAYDAESAVTKNHCTLKDISQDMTSLTHDLKSEPSNDCCRAIQDFALGPDSETQWGYLYCITRKSVKFYFDSEASRHMCGDKKLIRNLQNVPLEDRVTVYDADDNKMILRQAGEVNYGQIRLSPVFYCELGINYNIISLGELDDGNNLILTGDKRVKIFDVSDGTMIGEGYLHDERNEYIARSITSIKGTRKVSQAATQPSAAVDEKRIWLVDSLCNNHLTGDKNILYDRRSTKQTFITPKGKIQATEVGRVRTDKVTLFNVFYSPGLSTNIISEGQLDRDGYTCTRFAHKCHIQF